MAKTNPPKKTTASSKPSAGLFDDDFKTTKKDKRLIKRSTFVSRIEKPHKKSTKRRRPSKKLVTTLESLADALPDARNKEGGVAGELANVIRHKSLKSRPGAMKRKEKLDRLERERFGKNMAQMVVLKDKAKTDPDAAMDTTIGTTSGRWAALRNFLTQTMEQNPEFKEKK